MTPVEIAALVVAYLLAFARLFDSARWAWDWAPAWLQPVFPAVLTALPQVAGAFGVVETQLDLANAALVAFGTLTTAVRGALPPSQFERLSADGKSALRNARRRRIPIMSILACLSVAVFASACTPRERQVVARAAVDVAAELLCADFYAEKRGITVEQAKAAFCANSDVIKPWVEQVVAAKRAAGAASVVHYEPNKP